MFPKNTRLAIIVVIALLLIYHITRPFWLGWQCNRLIDVSIKFCIDFVILLIAWKGKRQNRRKRNEHVFLISVLYFIGDMIVTFSIAPAAIPYAVGHVLMMHCIINTCYTETWQYMLFPVMALCGIPTLIIKNWISR